MYCTPDCLAPGNTPVPEMTTDRWRVTDEAVPGRMMGWLITGWDYEGTEYGRKATMREILEISAKLTGKDR